MPVGGDSVVSRRRREEAVTRVPSCAAAEAAVAVVSSAIAERDWAAKKRFLRTALPVRVSGALNKPIFVVVHFARSLKEDWIVLTPHSVLRSCCTHPAE